MTASSYARMTCRAANFTLGEKKSPSMFEKSAEPAPSGGNA
jgi:hypothetical protein